MVPLNEDGPEQGVCAICQDLLKEAVSTDCGHLFCRVCLTQHAKKASRDLCCPLCRKPCSKGVLGEGYLCHRHQKRVRSFCEESKLLLCVECLESPEHRSHLEPTIGDAISHYKWYMKKGHKRCSRGGNVKKQNNGVSSEQTVWYHLGSEPEQPVWSWQGVEPQRVDFTRSWLQFCYWVLGSPSRGGFEVLSVELGKTTAKGSESRQVLKERLNRRSRRLRKDLTELQRLKAQEEKERQALQTDCGNRRLHAELESQHQTEGQLDAPPLQELGQLEHTSAEGAGTLNLSEAVTQLGTLVADLERTAKELDANTLKDARDLLNRSAPQKLDRLLSLLPPAGPAPH
ncbi:Tripartite motif-containing protein 40 [Fukomys damarensis]|uniref:Tripartite motif-containing protein 40 n=1 Tax=Fukomys damarensis TaxID=885580 RepID=A0A091D3H1_FUKDA|nr:Tripartite motif-containing protein 40 [Fukomys damarensis]